MASINSFSTETANDEGRPLVLVNPITGDDLKNDEGKLMTIYLVGQDSREFSSEQAQNYAKIRGGKTPSFGQVKKSNNKLLATCTKGWANIQLEEDQGDADFSTEAAMKLYQAQPWIKEQVDEFIMDRANFLGN